MNAIFDIIKNNNILTINGLEKINNEYLDENDLSINIFRKYKYSQSVTINILSKYVKDQFIYNSNIINNHSHEDVTSFTLLNDGLYKINHVIIPNLKWYNIIKNDVEYISQYSEIYYYDEITNKLMIVKNNIPEECEISELINATITSTIVQSNKLTFNDYFLKRCYGKICSEIINNAINCRKKDTKYDILFIGINAIDYALEFNNYYEAERILIKLQTCYKECVIKNCNCNG